MAHSMQDDIFPESLEEVAKTNLCDTAGYMKFWDGVVWFLVWFKNLIKNLLIEELSKLPVVGTYASNLGLTVSEFLITCLATLAQLLKVAFAAPQIWKFANERAMISWELNKNNGHLAQAYAYGKKMAACFLEIIKQCLEKSIIMNGLELSNDDKDNISQMLDQILNLD